MKVDIVTKKFKLNDNLKKIIDKKLQKLDKYFADEVSIRVILEEVRNDKAILELKIVIDKNRVLRATAIGDNMYDNIDVVIPKIEGQIRKLKTYNDKKLKQEKITNLFNEDMDLQEIVSPKIKRTKSLELIKLTTDEAIEEMLMNDREFYVFINAETNMVNVVYKRFDGEAGLLDLIY